jgi:hypothetical protein
MLRRRKEVVLFCPNVGRIWFCVHFATCYDGDFDEFDVTITSKNQNPAHTQSAELQTFSNQPLTNQRGLRSVGF